jgi:hypothetical protein
VYRGMRRITLTVVAVLLAVPAIAHAKVGIEFDNAIETEKPGDRQNFSVMVMNEPTDPMGGEPQPIVGVHPLVTFRNEKTGKVIRVRATRTNSEGIARGTVVLPDRGPWTASVKAGDRVFSEPGAQTFEIGLPTEAKVIETIPPPPDPAPASDDDGGGFPAWLLSFPAAGLVALGIWRLRRRPLELGA